MRRDANTFKYASGSKGIFMAIAILTMAALTTICFADVPDRTPPRGTVPNPGTQQQELANLTPPTPYNIFEFVGTCAACHGGTIDQHAGHFGNWAGTSMASSARDPIFRANQIGVNNAVRALTGTNGAGNMCFRCHSPNGWYGGRFDPTLGGDPEGRTMEHSILLSTDDEGILCEACHRTIGNVTMERADLNINDSVWNMLAGITDWPHAGGPYIDQDGDATIAPGNPYGDTTLQINDGMTYIGKYSGSVDIYFSDSPDGTSNYTGQTYGIDPASGDPWVDPDGSTPIHFELPIGAPINQSTGATDYQLQALSLEHPTAGDRPEGYLPLPNPVPPGNSFIKSPEFCGSCHELVIPILNHGMPEQRTYSEWKFSQYGANGDTTDPDYTRCQDCHMPTMKHEYADDAQVSLNPDPTVTGWFPYAKDRNAQGGSAFHKLTGSNRDLPMMMKLLYPEVDLELIGAPTGNDTRIFPGMLSHRDPMYTRAQRNTEIFLHNGVNVEIINGPANTGVTASKTDFDDDQDVDGLDLAEFILRYAANPADPDLPGMDEFAADFGRTDIPYRWTVNVKVTNTAGHRIPSGYPDGRRLWIGLTVSNGAEIVYESGRYDDDTATLYTDHYAGSPMTPFNRALEPNIDSNANAVMIYERITGECNQAMTECTPSPKLTNKHILFDNRILPAGYDYVSLRQSGVKFYNYDPATMVPYEDLDRYPTNLESALPPENWDIVTYTFDAQPGSLTARAELYWQTHSREFMEHLRTQDTSTVRPEGPPSIFDPNYPLNPNFLSDQIGLAALTSLDGDTLNDNWGGIAYAAWLLTGKGTPYLAAVDDTDPLRSSIPGVPQNVTTTIIDPFTVQIDWDPVDNAEGYVVWIRYGLDDATAAWDKLAVVYGTGLVNTALNVSKTYAVKVQAFNGTGENDVNALTEVVFTTPTDLPLPPENLQVINASSTAIELSWFDTADNETEFIIQRQDIPVVGDFYEVDRIPSQTALGATGGNSWTDTAVMPEMCYNYRVAAANDVGQSVWSVPTQACNTGAPGGNIVLDAVAGADPTRVDLSWSGATGTVDGYRIERSTVGPDGPWDTIFSSLVTHYSDLTVQPDITYWYRVFAYNTAGSSGPSNVAEVFVP